MMMVERATALHQQRGRVETRDEETARLTQLVLLLRGHRN